MQELVTVIFYLVIIAAIGAIGFLFRIYVIPWIQKKLTEKDINISQAEWDLAESIIRTLVESAFRLKSAGKITDAKAYVMELAKEQLELVGISLSDEMIDEIRRAAVIEWEKTVAALEDSVVDNTKEFDADIEKEIEIEEN